MQTKSTRNLKSISHKPVVSFNVSNTPSKLSPAPYDFKANGLVQSPDIQSNYSANRVNMNMGIQPGLITRHIRPRAGFFEDALSTNYTPQSNLHRSSSNNRMMLLPQNSQPVLESSPPKLLPPTMLNQVHLQMETYQYNKPLFVRLDSNIQQNPLQNSLQNSLLIKKNTIEVPSNLPPVPIILPPINENYRIQRFMQRKRRLDDYKKDTVSEIAKIMERQNSRLETLIMGNSQIQTERYNRDSDAEESPPKFSPSGSYIFTPDSHHSSLSPTRFSKLKSQFSVISQLPDNISPLSPQKVRGGDGGGESERTQNPDYFNTQREDTNKKNSKNLRILARALKPL